MVTRLPARERDVYVVRDDGVVERHAFQREDRHGFTHFRPDAPGRVPAEPAHKDQCFKTLRHAVTYLAGELERLSGDARDHARHLRDLLTKGGVSLARALDEGELSISRQSR